MVIDEGRRQQLTAIVAAHERAVFCKLKRNLLATDELSRLGSADE